MTARSRSRRVSSGSAGGAAAPPISVEIDSTIDYWTVKEIPETLDSLLDIVFVRRVLDRTSRTSRNAAFLQPYLRRHPNITFLVPNEAQQKRAVSHPSLTIGELIRVMKLNWESTDFCTGGLINVMQGTTLERQSLMSYILSRCSSREFISRAYASAADPIYLFW